MEKMSGARALLSMGENGRVLIPADLRAAIGLKSGGRVLARIDGDMLVIEPLDSAVRRVQAMMRPFAKPGESLVDTLLADRRKDASGD